MYSWHLRLAATNLHCCRQSWSLLCCRLGQLETGEWWEKQGGWKRRRRGKREGGREYTHCKGTLSPKGIRMHRRNLVFLTHSHCSIGDHTYWSSKIAKWRKTQRRHTEAEEEKCGPLMYPCYRGFHVHCLVSCWCSSFLHLCVSFEPLISFSPWHPCALICLHTPLSHRLWSESDTEWLCNLMFPQAYDLSDCKHMCMLQYNT